MKRTRYIYLLLGGISMLFAGIIYGWSILKAPLAVDFGWSPSQLAINFTITMSFFCLGGVLSGFLSRYTGAKITSSIGAVLTGAGFVIISMLSSPEIWILYFTYGVMAGMGIGMAYNSIISTVSMWFPDRKGLCSGILMMGFGSSALILGSIAGTMISLPLFGWRTTYLLLGVSITIVISATGFILKAPPKDVGLPVQKTTVALKKPFNSEREYTTKEMLRSSVFLKFFLLIVTMSAVGTTVISFAKDYAIVLGASAVFSTALVGVLSMFNGLGRILSGFAFDMLGRSHALAIANILTITAATVVLFAAWFDSLSIGMAGLCLTGLSYGCAPTITAAYTRICFGDKWFASNFSVMTMTLIPASFMATLSGKLYTSTGSYIAPAIALLISAAISMALGVSIRRQK